MIGGIRGLHHITIMASDARASDAFFTQALGLRRVKKTINFSEPAFYHLYYGSNAGDPGTLISCFPYPGMMRARPGVGEAGEIAFRIPLGSAGYWHDRLTMEKVSFTRTDTSVHISGPDGGCFTLIEDGTPDPGPNDILGLHSVRLRLHNGERTEDFLRHLGFKHESGAGKVRRFRLPGGNGADRIDLDVLPETPVARQGAGSVHHVAIAVTDLSVLDQLRTALLDRGYEVGAAADHYYHHAIFVRPPGGILFKISTEIPGFGRDEHVARLGEDLKLPPQFEPLRPQIEAGLEPLDPIKEIRK